MLLEHYCSVFTDELFCSAALVREIQRQVRTFAFLKVDRDEEKSSFWTNQNIQFSKRSMLQTHTIHKYHKRVYTAVNTHLTEKRRPKLDPLRPCLRGSFDKAEVSSYVIKYGACHTFAD